MRFKCPKCKNRNNFWILGDKRLKCKKCKCLFVPKENIANISNKLLKQIISEFVLEHSTNTILDRINVSKYKLL